MPPRKQLLLTLGVFPLLGAIAAFTWAGNFAEQRVDASGLPKFWEVVDSLRADRAPSRAQWDALFAAAGYAEYEEHERSRAEREWLITAAFKPWRKNEDPPAGVERLGIGRTIAHLQFALAHREQIEAFIAQLATDDFVSRAIAAAQDYLPPGCADPADALPIKLIVLYPGGRALPKAVVFDACLLSCSSMPHQYIGHELHHVFRRKLERVPQEQIAAGDVPLMKIISRMEMDGIADLIDKRAMVMGDDDLVRKELTHPAFRIVRDQVIRITRQAPEILAMVDAALSESWKDPSESKRIGEDLERELPWMAQQTVGMFMAMTIEGQLGRERVGACVGNPFAFFRAYQEAAAKIRNPSVVPTLSQEATSALAALERRYVPK
jgi:hypothetical protein